MKIDYVIISSDDNTTYKDFYHIVASRWNKLGFKTYYINITDTEELIKNKYGIIHKIKKLDVISTSFQSQVVRLFVSNLIKNSNILISDIDMLPINGGYFNQYLNQLTKKNVIIYSGQPYRDVPYYPMCYILSDSDNLSEILEIKGLNFSQYCKMLLEQYGDKWNCDENFVYDKLSKNQDRLIINNRNIIETRIDRSNWVYDIDKIKEGFYFDSHLLRPLEKNKKEITELLNILN